VKYFEDYVVGEEQVATSTYLVTEDEIIEIASRFDPQPFHTDPVAAKGSIFGGLVASSVHLFAISVSFSWHLGKRAAAVSALGFDEMRMRSPAYVGDRLRFRTETLSARRSESRPDCGIIQTLSTVFNQRDEVVFSYKGAFLVLRRDAAQQD